MADASTGMLPYSCLSQRYKESVPFCGTLDEDILNYLRLRYALRTISKYSIADSTVEIVLSISAMFADSAFSSCSVKLELRIRIATMAFTDSACVFDVLKFSTYESYSLEYQ